jgi:hypothetical protein
MCPLDLHATPLTTLETPEQMAAWQVELYIIPKRALSSAPIPLPIEMLQTIKWWAGVALPVDYRARFGATLPAANVTSPDVEAWGLEDANYIEVESEAGRAIRVSARIDVRRPDARLAAALITFARAAGAALVQSDGSAIELTAGGFGLALRSSAAWRHVHAQ